MSAVAQTHVCFDTVFLEVPLALWVVGLGFKLYGVVLALQSSNMLTGSVEMLGVNPDKP